MKENNTSKISKLHCITMDGLEYSHVQQAELLCKNGANWIQLRMKNATKSVWTKESKLVKKVCNDHEVKLIINDSIEIAKEVDADGVHLGNTDAPHIEARKILGPNKIIGGTVNSISDANRLKEEGIVNYVGVGPFKYTSTKENIGPILSQVEINRILSILGRLPAVMIGGITYEDIDNVIKLGAHGVAIAQELFFNNYKLPQIPKEDDDPLWIGNQKFNSRLILGSGRFPSGTIMKQSLEASKTEMVTVALKRIHFNSQHEDPVLNYIDLEKYKPLPNTSGARNAEEAVFAAQLGQEALGTNWVKVEIHPNPKYLMPDPIETLKATEQLVNLGFVVLPYVHADPVLCKLLEDAGAGAVMPLGSPIGSNQGLLTRDFLKIIIEQSNVPVIIDAGIGAPSHAAEAMELGADCILVNTAIACAQNPTLMAEAFLQATIAGRKAFLAKLATTSTSAIGSSPLTAFLK